MGTRVKMDRRALAALPRDPMCLEAVVEASDVLRKEFYASVSRSVMGRKGRTTSGTTAVDATSVYAHVRPNDPGWHLLEYGTADLPATRQIMHAVEATGMRFVDGGTE